MEYLKARSWQYNSIPVEVRALRVFGYLKKTLENCETSTPKLNSNVFAMLSFYLFKQIQLKWFQIDKKLMKKRRVV